MDRQRAITVLVAGSVLATATICIANAATKEEVDRCRSIQQRADRVACFNALKQTKPAKNESSVPPKADDVSSANGQSAVPANPGTTFRSNTVLPSRLDMLARTSTINDLAGRPVCFDRDGLAAVLMAGLLTPDPAQAVLPGCQTIPGDAKVEILERYPTAYPFMRLIKVKVTSHTKPDLTGGISVEVTPSAIGNSSTPLRNN
jgi:hypothetical protein